MRKFQQGGVSQVIPRPQDVGDIPVFDAPTFDIMSLPPQDIAILAHKMQLAKSQKEANDLAEQRYQDSLGNVYMDYNTKFFGPVHTTKQKETIAALQAKHGIADEAPQGILSNTVLLKDWNNKLRSAMSEQDFINVAGEVARGNEFRKYAQQNFDKETFVEWEQNAWQPYVSGAASIEDANPTRFKPSKEINANFRVADTSVMNDFDTADLTNEKEVAQMAQTLARAYYDTNPKAAEQKGLIKINPDGTYQLTAPALASFMDAVEVRQRDKQREYRIGEDKFEDRQALLDAYRDGNRDASNSNKKGSSSDLFPNLTTPSAIQIAMVERADILKQIPDLDPNDPDLLLEAEKLATMSVADRPTAKAKVIKALKAKAQAEVQNSGAGTSMLPGVSGSFLPQEPQSTPPTVSPVTPTTKLRFDPTTGKAVPVK